MLTTFETEDLIVQALRAGASAYLGKGVEPAALLDACAVPIRVSTQGSGSRLASRAGWVPVTARCSI
jgi:DNA-binding NarL/FixJ family response regulator